MLTEVLHAFIKANPEPVTSLEVPFECIKSDAGVEVCSAIYKFPISQITIVSDAFQPRRIHYSSEYYRSKGHVNALKKSLLNPLADVEPITICRLLNPETNELNWVLIDGHHRIEAYRLKKRSHIPAHILIGGALDAAIFSVGLNAKDKLSLTASEKLEAAWSIFLLKKGQAGQTSVVAQLGVSRGTLQNFRLTLRELEVEMSWSEILTMSWKEAKRFKKMDQTELFDSEKEARIWAELLFKSLGHRGKNSLEVFCEAIEIYLGETKFDELINSRIDRFYHYEELQLGEIDLSRRDEDFF